VGKRRGRLDCRAAGLITTLCKETVMKDPYKVLLLARVLALVLIWLIALGLVVESIWRLP